MMTHAYSQLYLDDAMDNLGEMFSYAVDEYEYDPDEFYRWFIKSKLADEFGQGNPRYLSGMSGIELADEIVYRTKGRRLDMRPSVQEERSSAYWAGWSLAYYQWYSGKRFKELYQSGLTMKKIMSMYILHEADISKFVESAEEILKQSEKEVINAKTKKETKL